MSASSCPKLLPDTIRIPFESGDQSATVPDYRLIGCWQGALGGNTFLLDEYFSPTLGGGVGIKHAGNIVAHAMIGNGPPTVVRFTGEYVCFAEKAGAYFVGVNLRTGAKMEDDAAQKTCPPPRWPPEYVLGLGHHKYRVAWHNF